MVRSMTGFGAGQAVAEDRTLFVEIRAVNHRYLEVIARLPRDYISLEDKLCKLVVKKIFRGRVEVFCNIEDRKEKQSQVKLDKGLAIAYHNSLKELAKILDIRENLSISEMMNLPGLFQVEEEKEDLDKLWVLLENALEKALAQLVDMREKEGKMLKLDLEKRIVKIEEGLENIKRRAPQVVEDYNLKLRKRVEKMLGEIQTELDEGLLAQEIVLFAERSDITEELVRLKSHLRQFSSVMEQEMPAGKKLGFIVQEINRELNTIGSKANDSEINSVVIELKNEVEKIREQVQNIE